GGVRPTWTADDRFWYRTTRDKGTETWLVDPAKPTRVVCELDACKAALNSPAPRPARNGATSPDRKRIAFIRDWNLWLREVGTNKEVQLTKDGIKDFGYATDNAGWTKSDRPILRWSPDSKKIATFLQDDRAVGEMYLVDTGVGHPKLQAWKYPLAGDQTLPMLHRVVIDVATGSVVRFNMPPELHRSSLCDDIACQQGEWTDVQWDESSSKVAFVSTSRDHRREQLRVANALSGDVRDVLQESVATFYESGNGRSNWRFLSASNEVVW